MDCSDAGSGRADSDGGSPPEELWELFQEPPSKLSGLQWVEVAAAGEKLRLLAQPPDRQLGGVDSQSDYTGTVVWPGGTAAAEYLHHCLQATTTKARGATGEPPAVLELGAGTGLPGLVAAKAHGAAAVVTDGNVQVVEMLRETLAANGLEDRMSAEVCRWGHAGDAAHLLRAHPGKFDIILAGDVMYSNWQTVLGLLLETVSRLLSERSGAKFILAAAFKRMGVASNTRALSHIARAASAMQMDVQSIDLGAELVTDVTVAPGVGCRPWIAEFLAVQGHMLVFTRTPNAHAGQ